MALTFVAGARTMNWVAPEISAEVPSKLLVYQPFAGLHCQTRAALPARPSSLGWFSNSAFASVAVAGITMSMRSWRRGCYRCRRTVSSAVPIAAVGCDDGGSPLDTKEIKDGDRLVRYLGGCVSVRALTATEMVRSACKSHGTSPIASVALGRALLGTALLASGRDAGETIQLRFQGDGPGGSIITEATSTLECRGFVGEPSAQAATVPELIGMSEDALLRITRMHPYWKRPYTGTSQLQCGEIAEDIVQYLATSEQTPASMGLSVEWDEEAGCVRHAEGWLVTLLPGWDDASVGVVEANIQTFANMVETDLPRPEAICEHMMRELLGSYQTEEQVTWRCNCSEKRLLSAVMLLGKTEVLKILREKKPVEARCDWCGGQLSVTADQVRTYMNSEDGKTEVETRSQSPRQLKLTEEELEKMPEPGTADWN